MKVASRIILIIGGALALVSALYNISNLIILAICVVTGVMAIVASSQKSKASLVVALIFGVLTGRMLIIIGATLGFAAFDSDECLYAFTYTDKDGNKQTKNVLLGGRGHPVSGMRKASKLLLTLGAVICLMMLSTLLSSIIVLSIAGGFTTVLGGILVALSNEDIMNMFNDLLLGIDSTMPTFAPLPMQTGLVPLIVGIALFVAAGLSLGSLVTLLVSAIVSLVGTTIKPKMGLHIANIVFGCFIFFAAGPLGLILGAAVLLGGLLVVLGGVFGLISDIKDKKYFKTKFEKEDYEVYKKAKPTLITVQK